LTKNEIGASLPNAHPMMKFIGVPDVVKRAITWLRSQLPDLDPKSLLPFSFRVQKGIITCGNTSTPSILVSEFVSADGLFGNVKVGFTCYVSS
jgi:hypothetical protein